MTNLRTKVIRKLPDHLRYFFFRNSHVSFDLLYEVLHYAHWICTLKCAEYESVRINFTHINLISLMGYCCSWQSRSKYTQLTDNPSVVHLVLMVNVKFDEVILQFFSQQTCLMRFYAKLTAEIYVNAWGSK